MSNRLESKFTDPLKGSGLETEQDLAFELMEAGFHRLRTLLDSADSDEAMKGAYEFGLFIESSFSFPTEVLLAGEDIEDLEGDEGELSGSCTTALNAITSSGDWIPLKEVIHEVSEVFYQEAIKFDSSRRTFYRALGWNPTVVHNERQLITSKEHNSWFQNRLNDSLAKVPNRTAPWEHPNPQSMQKLVE